MKKNILLKERCKFKTGRLIIESWQPYLSSSSHMNFLAKKLISILTQEVTKSLPDGWQGVDTTEKALAWIKHVDQEGPVFTIQNNPNKELIGLLFLYEENAGELNCIDIRLGYLLAEHAWGKGFGSELIKGLVQWCEMDGNVASISGGVENDKIASIKVLEKNGFVALTQADAPERVVFLEKSIGFSKLHQHFNT